MPADVSTQLPRAAVILLAGGSGLRLGGDVNKVYLPLGGEPMLAWSLRWIREVSDVGRVVLVVRDGDHHRAAKLRALLDDRVELVTGGASRQGSELAGLRHLRSAITDETLDVVAVHDGARPLAGPELLRAVLRGARRFGGAVPVLPAEDLVPIDGQPTYAAGRLVRVQTPQAFRAGPLLAAYEQAAAESFDGTDTASTVERYTDLRVEALPGDAQNIKITYPQDLLLAERLLAAMSWAG